MRITPKKSLALVLLAVSAYAYKMSLEEKGNTTQNSSVAASTPNTFRTPSSLADENTGVIQIQKPEATTEVSSVDGQLDLQVETQIDAQDDYKKTIPQKIIGPEILHKEAPQLAIAVDPEPVHVSTPEVIPAPSKKEIPQEHKIEEKISSEENFSQSKLSVGLINRYIKLTGKDSSTNTTGSLYSPALLGVDLSWKQYWTEKFHSFISFDILKVTIDPSATKTLNDRKLTLSRFAVGVEEKFNDTLSASISIGKGDELVYRALDSQNLKIEKIGAPKIELAAKIRLAQKRKLSLDAEGAYLITLPFKNDYYSSKTGSGYKGKLEVIHQEENFNINANVFYSNYTLPVGTVKFTRTDIGVGLGFSWSFGK